MWGWGRERAKIRKMIGDRVGNFSWHCFVFAHCLCRILFLFYFLSFFGFPPPPTPPFPLTENGSKTVANIYRKGVPPSISRTSLTTLIAGFSNNKEDSLFSAKLQHTHLREMAHVYLVISSTVDRSEVKYQPLKY